MRNTRTVRWVVGAVLIAMNARAEEPELRLPLDEYEKLRTASEGPALTVIDQLRITGAFKGDGLSVTLSGHATGKKPAVSILKGDSGLRLFDCKGPAIVSRGASAFELTPLATQFQVHCRLVDTGSDRLELTTTSEVLWVEAAVKDGEPIIFDAADGGRAITIVHGGATTHHVAPPTAIGRYRLTLQPDETQFRYQFEVHNPNRGRARFELTLHSGENVQKVDSKASYEADASTYRFDLAPGDHTVVLTGTLSDGSFTPPIDASVQFLLLEAHPMLRPEIKAAKRVSVTESGLEAQHRGAQAFLLAAGEKVTWTVTRLEAMHTTGFSVPQAVHSFFVTSEAGVVGESSVTVNNQGAADLALPMKAEPTYASIDGAAILLTKNDQGDLWTPIAPGKQSLQVQYQEGLDSRFGLAWGNLWLPQLAGRSSTTEVVLKYSGEWTPLYQRFQSDLRMPMYSTGDAFWYAGLAVWSWLMLQLLGLSRARAAWLAGFAVLGAFAAPWMTWALIAANVLLLLVWKPLPGISETIVIAGLAAMAVVGVVTLFGQDTRTLFAASTDALAGRTDVTTQAMKGMQTFGKNLDPEYKGLPAHVEVPAGVSRTEFGAEMLSTERPTSARVLLIRTRLLALVRMGAAFLALLVLFSQRGRFAAGVQRLYECRRPSPEPAMAG